MPAAVVVSRLARPATRDLDWRDRASCRGSYNEAFFPHPNTLYVPEVVDRVCAACPVRPSCLAEGIVHREHGIWGGTTERQRQALRRRYRRDSCPACGPSLVIPFDDRQVCTSCGLAWIATKARNRAGLVPVPV